MTTQLTPVVYLSPTQGGITAKPGDLVEVEAYGRDACSGLRVVIGYSRDGDDLRLSNSDDPADAILGELDWYVPAHRCRVVRDADPVVTLLACWFDFAIWSAQ